MHTVRVAKRTTALAPLVPADEAASVNKDAVKGRSGVGGDTMIVVTGTVSKSTHGSGVVIEIDVECDPSADESEVSSTRRRRGVEIMLQREMRTRSQTNGCSSKWCASSVTGESITPPADSGRIIVERYVQLGFSADDLHSFD